MEDNKLYRFFSNESTEEEVKEIEAWIKCRKENTVAFSNAYKRYVMISMAALNVPEETRIQKNKSRRNSFLRILLGMAGAAAAVAVGIFIGNGIVVEDESQPPLRIVADAGQRANVILADGTKVILNSGSSLEYPSYFTSRQRKVRLSGEAMFDVTSDAEHPFVVETFEYDVKVLGTKFDVIAEESTGVFSTALFEGKVSVSDKDGCEVAELDPDQKVSINNGLVSIKKIGDVAEESQWADGVVSITGLSFEDAIGKIAKSYGVNIRIERTEMPELRFSYLKLRISDGIDHALESLQKGADFTYSYNYQKNEYTIR